MIGGAAFVMSRSIQAGNWASCYSTMRSDPLGASVLYNAMAALPGITVERNHSDLAGLSGGEGDTLFLVGIAGRTLIDEGDNIYTLRALHAFVNNGGRLVISFAAAPSFLDDVETTVDEDESDDPDEDGEAEEQGDGESEDSERPSRHFGRRYDGDGDDGDGELSDEDMALITQWNMRLIPEFKDWRAAGWMFDAERLPEWDALPKVLTWHSPFYLEAQDAGWYPVYCWPANVSRPTVLERAQMNGSVVVIGDSFFFSNEAMSGARNTPLLTWLVGDARRVIFDETHLGLSRSPGMMTLVRRYRFHGVVLALLAAGLLFVWRGACSLTPPRPEVEAEEELASNSAAGLTNLLRRSLPPSRLLAACLQEWRRSRGQTAGVPSEVMAELESLCRADSTRRELELLTAYRRICAVLAERGIKRG